MAAAPDQLSGEFGASIENDTSIAMVDEVLGSTQNEAAPPENRAIAAVAITAESQDDPQELTTSAGDSLTVAVAPVTESQDQSLFTQREADDAENQASLQASNATSPASTRLSAPAALVQTAAITLSAHEMDRVLPTASFDLTYDLSDGITQEALSTFPINVYLEVEAGDTLSSLFQSVGISIVETQRAGQALGQVFHLGSLRPGQVIELELDGAVAPFSPERLQRLSLAPTNLEVIEVVREGESFASRVASVELQRFLVHASGSLATGSIYVDGTAMNIEGSMIANFVNALDAQVNFSRIQSAGDEIEMVYEAYFNEAGDLVDAGDVLYAAYRDQGGEDYEAFLFENAGKAAYFTRDARFTGQTNTLMRKPLAGGRLSSRYGWRTHPVHGDRRFHYGVDYAASCGTPVYAAGNGVVSFAGWRGGYGKFIGVRHGSTYVTHYAHLRSFANGIRPGTRVRKGQLIGRVGTTGVSTGCHLHYEVVKNGDKINPLSDHIPRGDDLAAAARTRFRAFAGQMDAVRESGQTLEQATARARAGGGF